MKVICAKDKNISPIFLLNFGMIGLVGGIDGAILGVGLSAALAIMILGEE